jgi:hypothetical protein
MTGGLLNIQSYGKQNIAFHSNPQTTFFTSVYKTHTNFGKQTFRIDYAGSKELSMNNNTTYTFKYPKNGDLISNNSLVIKLPNIWSPVAMFQHPTNNSTCYIPYEFKWIEDIGFNIIEDISVTCGGQLLHKCSGEFMLAMIKRDFNATQHSLINAMSGNTSDLNNPSFNRGGNYPNAVYTEDEPAAPSIIARDLTIPINLWYTLNKQQAFPLVALKYNDLQISITLRPVREWYTIRDVLAYRIDGDTTIRKAPNINMQEEQFHIFLQEPFHTSFATFNENYLNTTNVNSRIDFRTAWNSDINIIADYIFLTNDERRVLSETALTYIIKTPIEHTFHNVSSTTKLKIMTTSMISSWIFFLRRSDVKIRNEWSNYSNWEYNNIPPVNNSQALYNDYANLNAIPQSGPYVETNKKEILNALSIMFDGEYRERLFSADFYKYHQKYLTSSGGNADMYYYNFCNDTSPFNLQPSGEINIGYFKNIEMEVIVTQPPIDPVGVTQTVTCDEDTGEIISVQSTNSIYEYTYDFILFEERYNMLLFSGGSCGLNYAR